MVRNVQTAIDLAYVYGAILGELGMGTKKLEKVAPISWQSGIGYPNLKSSMNGSDSKGVSWEVQDMVSERGTQD